MELVLRKGQCYALRDPARPSLLKLGRAGRSHSRLRQLQTGNPWLQLVHLSDFYHDVEAESAIHRRFARRRGKGEFFEIPLQTVVAFYGRLAADQALQYGHLDTDKRYGQNAGLLPLPASLRPAKVPAVRWLLSQPCPGASETTIGEAVQQALTQPDGSARWVRPLRKLGLELQSHDKIVVFNKRVNGTLQKAFESGEARSTWRKQLEQFAGIDNELRVVKLKDWMRFTMSTEEVKAGASA